MRPDEREDAKPRGSLIVPDEPPVEAHVLWAMDVSIRLEGVYDRMNSCSTLKCLRLILQPIVMSDFNSDLALTSNSAGALNKTQLSTWMDAHALTRSSHHCAMYCRLGLEAGGISTEDRPRSGDAGDYGPFLLRHGAQTVSQDSYVPQVGDVVVFDKTVQHPYGHIEMYDGHHWVSDFMQHSFSPYHDANSTPTFTIYRLA